MKKKRAKIFQNGGSQAVRLPKEFRFNAPEVMVFKQGRSIVLEPIVEPKDEWPEEFLAILGSVKEKLPRPKQRRVKDMRDPFA
ncbi:MAG: AbrB/MazE/SpoVT family DNA-binding domain-containing protein [Candidatus Hydrogenedentes bacterium]|nr:AbrB/MazE/SpoVT family DNA-binding domain-containing protein [Candidatus Hydrogenedentota bacterium]